MGIITKRIACIYRVRIFDGVRLKFVCKGLLIAASVLATGIAYPAEVKKPSAQDCPQPKDDQVAVRSASGKCDVRGPGIYSNPAAIGLRNESIDMIFVPSSVRAVVCGLDLFNDLKCEKPFPSSSWSDGKNFKKLSGAARWTFLQVVRWDQEKEFECRPKDNEVTISARLMGFSEGIGPCIRLKPGTYNTAKDIGLTDIPFAAIDKDKLVDKARQEGRLLLKDKPLLVQIGSSVQMKMCRGDNFLGGCVVGQQNQRYESASLGYPGLLGSMKVWMCIPQDKQVVLFSGPDAAGACTIREVGEYLTAESLTIEGSAIGSVKVGWLVEARMCSGENMTGECFDIKERRTEYNLPWTIKSLRVRSPQDDAKVLEWTRKAAEQGDAAAQASLGVMYATGRGGLPQDDAKALEWTRKAVAQGNARAQNGLGVMYLTGRGGLPQDDAQAVEWYQKAAAQGYAAAQANLGFMYLNGRGGLPQDDAQAVEWYRKAAAQGNASGQASLGFMYEKGRGGLPQEDAQAVEWYRKAAAQGNAWAQNNLKNRGLKW